MLYYRLFYLYLTVSCDTGAWTTDSTAESWSCCQSSQQSNVDTDQGSIGRPQCRRQVSHRCHLCHTHLYLWWFPSMQC